jgi:Fic family protein
MAQQAEPSKPNSVVITEADLRQLDAEYKAFPTFQEWSNATVDTVRWDRYTALLREERSKASPQQIERARKIALRAAAVDTGAIEGLYEVDSSFTFTVAMEAAAWEVALSQKGETVRSLIESQINAYDYVVDLATKAEPTSEAAIRELHAQVVAAQRTYRVVTVVGFQEQSLPKGEYKVLPNHVRGRDGRMHSYAPVDLTPAEMYRLVNELRGENFLAAHPVLQASFAHYAFVAIHPFADGNGRVARALASVFMCRALSIPLLVLAEQKRSYLAALETADRGDFQPFVNFTLDRTLEAIQLVQESVRAADASPIDESLKALGALYTTKGGYTHEQVDEAGHRLLAAMIKEAEEKLNTLDLRTLTKFVHPLTNDFPSPPNHRNPLSGNKGFVLTLLAGPPINTAVSRSFYLHMPKDCGPEDDLILAEPQTKESLTARIDEVIPSLSSVLQIRIKIFVEGLLSRCVAELQRIASAAYRQP